MVVADAILVRCADGLGQLTSYSNPAFGLVGGYMAHITGRLGLDGSKTIAGDTAIATWYEDLLAEGQGDFLPSRKLDIVEGGNLEDVSAMSFTWLNTAALAATLEANGIYLYKCKVTYFRVTTTDFVTFTFRQRWFGVIDDQQFNEVTQQIQCVSSDKDAFQSAPTVPVNPATFPLAPADSKDQYLPIPLGRVGFSPLMNVKGAGQKTVLNIINSVSYTFAALEYINGPQTQVGIKTSGIVFSANDTRLVGKYLNQIDGAVTQTLLIIANTTTVADPGEPHGYTTLTLSDPLSGTPVLWSLFDSTSKPWFFEVIDLTVALIAADGDITEVNENASGRPRLARYLSDANRYEDVSEAGFQSSLTSISQTGFPGYSCRAKSTDASADIPFPFPIVPKSITISETPNATNTFPALRADAPLLKDLDATTGYTLYTNPSLAYPDYDQVQIDLTMAEVQSAADFGALYVLPDFSVAADTGTADIDCLITVSLVDIYGRQLNTGVSHDINFGTVDTTEIVFNSLPQFYFGLPDDAALDANYNTTKYGLNIHGIISDTKISNLYNRVRVNFFFNNLDRYSFHFTLNEIGLIGVKSVNISTEKIYGALKGRTFGSTWNGRKTATDPILRPHEAIEKIIRDINSKATPWAGSTNYPKGYVVRSVADNSHYFQCTVAGVSGTLEPAWTTTTDATYTDGTVTWKEIGTVPIDEASFDALALLLSNWLIGYTLEDVKPTQDWIRMLLQHAWLAGVTDRFGKFKIKSWLDADVSIAAFDKTNIYGKSLLVGITYSAMSRAYNNLSFSYDYNPASQKLNRQIVITNVDKPAFPGPSDMASTGIALGTFSASYISFGGGLYIITLATMEAHNLKNGDYAGLAGNTQGFDFFPSFVISIVDDNTFKVLANGNVFTALTSSIGTLTRYTNVRFAWMDYVIGIRNYAQAAGLWNDAHAGFMVSKTVNPMPEELGKLYFYFDPYATDANGDLLWPDLDVGDAHAAVFHVQRAVQWLPYPKPQGYLQVIDDGTFDFLENADPVTLTDDKVTGGASAQAWICEITQLPKTDTDPHRIQFGLIFKPGALASLTGLDAIDEMGAGDYLDEAGATDYTDDGV